MARSINLKGQKNVKAIAAVVGGLVAFAVLGYLVVLSPESSKASKLDGEIAAAQQQLSAAQASAAVRPPVDPRVDDLFRLTKAMPAQPDMPGILLELSRVAHDTGITFDSISPGAPTTGSSYATLPIELAFKGNYYELSDFLFRVNNLVAERNGKLDVGGRLFTVDGVNFSPAGATGTTLVAKISAQAYIYGTGGADGGAAPGAAAAATTPPAATTTPSATTPPAATTTPATTTPPATSAPSAAAAPAAGSAS